MQFIGRQAELAKLNEEYSRDGSFVVIYGRRRVGKTTLIKEFLKGKRAFYFLATEELEGQSMKRLAGVVARATGNSLLQKAAFGDWLDLFQVIAEYRPKEKKVLVLDEFPYLVRANPAFPSILQNAWDELLKDSAVMVILCGSLMGMMQKHALSYDSPLYGRRTAQIRLVPLPFTEVYAAQDLTFSEAVEQYSVTGGGPKYLEFFQDGQGLRRQLMDTVLSKNGFLYEEPYFLLKSSLALSLHLAGSASSFPKPLSPEEEQQYLARCAQGDLEARNILVERNMRLVAHIIKKYYTQTVDQDDLISIGTIGLIKGISSYKPEKNVRLATYAARCIENEVLMFFRSQKKAPG